jgi:hypothetical protein
MTTDVRHALLEARRRLDKQIAEAEASLLQPISDQEMNAVIDRLVGMQITRNRIEAKLNAVIAEKDGEQKKSY